MLSPGAKTGAPLGASIIVRQPSVDHAALGGTTLFVAPAGCLSTDNLAQALEELHKPALWIRLSQEDRDAGAPLLSLMLAARQLQPGIGSRTLERMKKQPGAVFGWNKLYAELGKEMAESLPRPFAIVIEQIQQLNHSLPTLNILSRHFLGNFPPDTTIVMIASEPVPGMDMPAGTRCKGVDALSLDVGLFADLIRNAGLDLSNRSLTALKELTRLYAEPVACVLLAAEQLGPTIVSDALARATSTDDFFARLARACLNDVDPEAQRSLSLALHLNSFQPDQIRELLGCEVPFAGPWLQSLSSGWIRIREMWLKPLHIALRAWGSPTHNTLRNVAQSLAAHGQASQAVRLYFEAGDISGAAHVITSAADDLIDYGLWDTLDDWLNRFPPTTLQSWPWLIYARGEIAAAQDDLQAARRYFSTSAALFTARYDADGACQSLLAESALASWQGERAHAQLQAQVAKAMAEASGLEWHVGWAIWQLGCIAAADGQLDDAQACFNRVGSLETFANEVQIAELIRRVEYLALEQRDLRTEREFHRQAFFSTDQAEQQAAERLRILLGAPLEGLEDVLGLHGWSRTPLMLKLPSPMARTPEVQCRPNLWGVLQNWLGLRRKSPQKEKLPAFPDPPANIINGYAEVLSQEEVRSKSPAGEVKTIPLASERASVILNEVATPQAPEAPMLAVYLLGQFRVLIHDHPVESWPSGRGRALFKYLIANRERNMPRDVLMETFWPNTAPAAARNSLNVALHGLRQAFKGVTDIPVIEFGENAYRFSQQLTIWLDVEDFERRLKAGLQLEENGKLMAAAVQYEMAAGLYQGDFLPDEPYEEWAVLPRERLRLAHLDMLDRLSHIYFSQGHYASCITLCQSILAQDGCREDAHCRLMRCYSRQSQHHLAVRQYEVCVASLLAELGIKPAAATTQLVQRIRRRERV